jgi:hypothetical protein
MRIIIRLLADRNVLAGADYGRQMLAKLITALPSDSEPSRCFLDFAGAPPTTGSFLRECVLGFRRYVRGQGLPIYPVVANAAAETVEEFEHLLEMVSDAFPACTLDEAGAVHDPRVLGVLEPTQRRTLSAVIQAGSTTATALASKFTDDEVTVTAWNNRLAALAQKGLLLEHSAGRAKTYEPVLEGM